MRRKSQMEVMGLAIIVVIVIIGILLSLRFMKSSTVDETESDFTDSTLASNMLNVMLKTDLDCSGKDLEMSNLLQDCAEDVKNKDYCYVGDSDPCAKAQGIIEFLLEETLVEMKKDYYFEAKLYDDVKISLPAEPTCTSESVGKAYSTRISESYPLPTKKGTMEISLAICR